MLDARLGVMSLPIMTLQSSRESLRSIFDPQIISCGLGHHTSCRQ
jgi:hypothetical protein